MTLSSRQLRALLKAKKYGSLNVLWCKTWTQGQKGYHSNQDPPRTAQRPCCGSFPDLISASLIVLFLKTGYEVANCFKLFIHLIIVLLLTGRSLFLSFDLQMKAMVTASAFTIGEWKVFEIYVMKRDSQLVWLCLKKKFI